MDIASARTLKHQLGQYVTDLLTDRIQATSTAAPLGVALGLAPRGDGQFDVAVRYRLGTPTARMIARRLVAEAGTGLDVRRTGRIMAPERAGPGAPVPTALAAGETGRVRPLRPGVSVAHHSVTAGTLGGFVTTTDGEPGVHALSNYHVLVGSPSVRVGEAVLQPAPADGGQMPEDEVGALSAFVPLGAGGPSVVDAALARLVDADVDPTYPVGRLTGTAAALGGEAVEKIGRTTGVTRGRVSAIELDGIVVGYGAELGELTFDDQIEVESTGSGPFSSGGDSGSVVYRLQDGRAIGLLFAGSETGGENGSGLTYLNPIDEVLSALGATLV
ncbi:hypothetical protein [Georgenia wangjunii]|uniref:hypothetical protein n=1 Tax=Georgenia wangjunii TaxID=3117730 RepID=UPI002F265CE8